MATDCIPQVTFDFQGVRQPIVARFDQAHASSEGGALLLKAIDERLARGEGGADAAKMRARPGCRG